MLAAEGTGGDDALRRGDLAAAHSLFGALKSATRAPRAEVMLLRCKLALGQGDSVLRATRQLLRAHPKVVVRNSSFSWQCSRISSG